MVFMKVKICAVQFDISKNFESNLKKAEKFMKTANLKKCDIICFPELFLTGPLKKEGYNHKIALKSKKSFQNLCKKYSIYCVTGSIIEKTGKRFYNKSYLISDKGKIIGSYSKNHLAQNSEGRFISPGNEPKVFKTKIGNIGIQICRDLLYPEITRKMMLKKAQIVFCLRETYRLPLKKGFPAKQIVAIQALFLIDAHCPQLLREFLLFF